MKHLPTGEALAAWFGRYGRHTRCLHLRHLDAGKQALLCVVRFVCSAHFTIDLCWPRGKPPLCACGSACF